MEMITPVSSGEILYARGTYHYRLGANDTLIREPWTIHEKKDGEQIFRIERDATVFNAKLLTEFTKRNDEIVSINIRWENSNPEMVQKAEASYRFEGNSLKIDRVCDDTTYQEIHSLDATTLISPLMRICIGFVLKKLLNYQDGTTVLIPNIKKPVDKSLILGAHFEHRKAKGLSHEPVQAGDKVYQSTSYQYTGELYDENARFWVDKHDILLRYTWKQSDGMIWDVRLHDYKEPGK